MAKVRKARLGRGISSLMATPVSVEPPAAQDAVDPATKTDDAQSNLSENQLDEAVTDNTVTIDPTKTETKTVESYRDEGESSLLWIGLNRIIPNRYQPRQIFDPEGLEQLAQSIRNDGLIQPIVVQPADSDGKHEIVAGERRWRAAQMVGLDILPALIRKLDERQMAEWALIENLQRRDLNPIERAEAFESLIKRHDLTHQDVAERVGVNRSSISNTLRLLDLSSDCCAMVSNGLLSYGHGRALAVIEDAEVQTAMGRKAVEGGWSVRQMEQAVRTLQEAAEPSSKKKPAGAKASHLSDLEKQLAAQLETKVRIKAGRKKNSGTVSIDFYDLEQFDALMQRLNVSFD